MTDSHCHLDHGLLKENLDDELESFVKNGGVRILNAGSSIEDFPLTIATARKYRTIYPNLIKSSLGLHPETLYSNSVASSETISLEKVNLLVSEFESTVEKNIDLLSSIGETGLDYHQLIGSEIDHSEIENVTEVIEAQKLSFRRHLIKAIEHKLPLTIHSRENQGQSECIQDSLKIITEIGKGQIQGSMHSYTGPIEQLQDILDLGLFVGFNGIITYKSGGDVRELLKQTPIERILLETDAPYLPLRHKNAQSYGNPTDIQEIAKVAAEIKNVSVKKLLEITTDNFIQLFG
ncbi:hypothetical protein GF357_04185 [Candidatus Dojkabacteria bacterium]|nr:hypothetical protein [Candidatus Dojkabacteria bacterium]